MPTKIAWTDETWNPVTGCSHVSPGCVHCYAESLSHRFGWTTKPWRAQHAAENVRLHPERLNWPAMWRKPKRVFVCSMADLFHERVPFSFVKSVLDVALIYRQHTYQILTKRPGRVLEFLWEYPAYAGLLADRPAIWIGVSVEDQRRADERIPLLLQVPAAVRFLSVEPLLGPVDLSVWLEHIDWVIVGGESGPGYRPLDLDWARSLRDQCQAAGAAFWFKQSSGPRPGMNPTLDGQTIQQWPEVRS